MAPRITATASTTEAAAAMGTKARR
jgi:hypothetical protein